MKARRHTIALPISSFLPAVGGAEVGLHNIAIRLVERGHRAVVVVPSRHWRALRRRDWKLPYEVARFPPKIWGVLRHWPAVGLRVFDRVFSRLQARYRFDFWHATMGYPTGVALVHWARTRSGVPHLVRCTGEDIQRVESLGYGARRDPRIDRLVRRWLPRADVLVAITSSVAEEYRALGVAPERIAEIPNGVDLARFVDAGTRAATRERLGIGRDAFAFLAVGRNHPKKNFEAIVRASAVLARRVATDFVVLIAGGGVDRLAPLVAGLGLGERVRLVDEVGASTGDDGFPEVPGRDLVDLYRAADAFVFPSRVETFGVVLVEAMASGLPVVTADSPGCRDVVRADVDGVVLRESDDEALAAVMQRLIAEPAWRETLVRAARARAAQFSWDGVVDRYVALYDAAAEARHAGATGP